MMTYAWLVVLIVGGLFGFLYSFYSKALIQQFKILHRETHVYRQETREYRLISFFLAIGAFYFMAVGFLASNALIEKMGSLTFSVTVMIAYFIVGMRIFGRMYGSESADISYVDDTAVLLMNIYSIVAALYCFYYAFFIIIV